MILKTLIDDLGLILKGGSPEGIAVIAVTDDSRRVTPGSLFIAVPGANADGSRYIPQAIKSGASVIIAAEGAVPGDHAPEGVVFFTHPDPRAAVAQLAARWYAKKPEQIVAVTGTDGKTSVAHFCRQFWEFDGQAAASLGTIGVRGSRVPEALKTDSLANTTPGALALHKLLQDLAEGGVNHVVMEASSHGIDQHRLDGVPLAAAAFTNLTRDHLDYHGTVEAYFQAKARLFRELLPEDGTAIVNIDDPRGPELEEICGDRGQEVLTYGRHAGADLRIVSYTPTPSGAKAEVKFLREQAKLNLSLLGGFQLENILAAAGLAYATGMDEEKILEVIPLLQGVPGRMQKVTETPKGATVIVDYAHTPGALEHVLKAVRAHVSGKLTAVMGCGGDRDTGKRPLMGDVASKFADRVVVTDDNPRTEAPAPIRKAIMEGMTGKPDEVLEIADRREAIFHAVQAAGRGDIVVIAGKGHEREQIIGAVKHPFDDVAVALEAAQLKEKVG